MPVQAGRPVLFACGEMIELMEELVGSYLTQVHLQHELESNDYDRFCQTTIYKGRADCLSLGSVRRQNWTQLLRSTIVGFVFEESVGQFMRQIAGLSMRMMVFIVNDAGSREIE
jgi:hypothetical protein